MSEPSDAGRPVRVSVSLTNVTWPAGAGFAAPLTSLARAAEDAGLDTLWVADHLLQSDPASRPDEPMLEAYTTLGYLAARTDRIRLGTLVTAATYRHPALLVKLVTTLDALSGGRAWLGLGAGYQGAEAAAMGLDLPPTGPRFDALTDIVELARHMWSGDGSGGPGPFAGRTIHAANPICRPAPMRHPHPPILIGGTGERRTLRLVARHADACNVFDVPDDGATVRRQLDVLARHCADVGRDYAEIDRTISTAIEPGEHVTSVADRFARLAGLGITHVIAIARGRPVTEEDITTLGRAAERLNAA